MMSIVVDSSVLAAVVFGEPDGVGFAELLRARAGQVSVSAATLLEARIVVRSRQGEEAVADLETLLRTIEAEVVPFDERQAALAFDAWRRFGKGQHVAALNFGDCISYALARALGAPLLYKGKDFAATDVASIA